MPSWGAGVLARTTDGGRHWIVVGPRLRPYAPAGAPKGVCCVRFLDRRRGFLFGGPLLSTTDGGRRWTILPSPIPVIDVRAAGHRVYALGLDWPREKTARVYRLSQDRLIRIGPRLPVTGAWPQLVVDGPGVYVLAPGSRPGRRFTLWASRSAGRTWRRLRAPCTWPNADGGALAAWSPVGLALACGAQPAAGNQAKAFYVSTDGGASWRLTARIGFTPGRDFTGGYIAGLAAASATTWALAEARGGIMVSHDGGRTWRWGRVTGASAGLEGFGSVAFIDATHGVAVPWTLNGDLLAFTADGGRHWRAVNFASSAAPPPASRRSP